MIAISVCVAGETEGNDISSEKHFFFAAKYFISKSKSFDKSTVADTSFLLTGERRFTFPYLIDQGRMNQ